MARTLQWLRQVMLRAEIPKLQLYFLKTLKNKTANEQYFIDNDHLYLETKVSHSL
jgi:hypothetical protein